MNKIIIYLVLFFLTAVPVYANPFMQLMGVGVTAESGCTDSHTNGFVENFEGTGYESSWGVEEVASGGEVNEDYTTTVLRGSQSLYLLGASSNYSSAKISFTGGGTVYGHFMFRAADSTPASSRVFLYFLDSTDTSRFQIYGRTDGRIRVYHGTNYLTTTNVELADNTTYHFWFQYAKGTGSDGVYKLWKGTSEVFSSASLVIDGSNGNATADVDELYLTEYNGEYGGLIFDQVIISTDSIGDVCE